LEIPDHCDGVNLIPFLTGEETGDAHEYLFWLNSEPGDAVRRHLIAVRWKDWRLYRKYADDEWQLFDLRKDPCEENNIAAQNPEVVRQMAKRHAAWERTLVPVAEIPVLKGQAEVVPKGHGWATASTGK
jgi:arylsulfatase A-like enzyme